MAGYPTLKTSKYPETISEALFTTTYTSTQARPQIVHLPTRMDIPREILENIQVFDGKPESIA